MTATTLEDAVRVLVDNAAVSGCPLDLRRAVADLRQEFPEIGGAIITHEIVREAQKAQVALALTRPNAYCPEWSAL